MDKVNDVLSICILVLSVYVLVSSTNVKAQKIVISEKFPNYKFLFIKSVKLIEISTTKFFFFLTKSLIPWFTLFFRANISFAIF